jgi:hypothetical protein
MRRNGVDAGVAAHVLRRQFCELRVLSSFTPPSSIVWIFPLASFCHLFEGCGRRQRIACFAGECVFLCGKKTISPQPVVRKINR